MFSEASRDHRLTDAAHAAALVVVGGHDGVDYLKSVEMYEVSARQWRALPDMSVARYDCCAACIDGNVYVMGGKRGWGGGCNLKSAEMYDASTGQWRALPDMSVARNGCAVVCIEGNVYVMGGYEGHSHSQLRSVEMYDASSRHRRCSGGLCRI